MAKFIMHRKLINCIVESITTIMLLVKFNDEPAFQKSLDDWGVVELIMNMVIFRESKW